MAFFLRVGFADVITLIKGRVEDIVLPVDKVDVIISEWMVSRGLLQASMQAAYKGKTWKDSFFGANDGG